MRRSNGTFWLLKNDNCGCANSSSLLWSRQITSMLERVVPCSVKGQPCFLFFNCRKTENSANGWKFFREIYDDWWRCWFSPFHQYKCPPRRNRPLIVAYAFKTGFSNRSDVFWRSHGGKHQFEVIERLPKYGMFCGLTHTIPTSILRLFAVDRKQSIDRPTCWQEIFVTVRYHCNAADLGRL